MPDASWVGHGLSGRRFVQGKNRISREVLTGKTL